MTTAPSDRNPRRSRTKSLLGTLLATALLFGALQAVSPVSAAAMMDLKSEEECNQFMGTWDWFNEICDYNFGGGGGGGSSSDSGGGGGGDAASGGADSAGDGSGGQPLEVQDLPLDQVDFTLQEIEELLRDPDLIPEQREILKKMRNDKLFQLPPKSPNELYPEDPNNRFPADVGDDNVFDPSNLPERPPTLITRGPGGKPASAARKNGRKAKAKSRNRSRAHG